MKVADLQMMTNAHPLQPNKVNQNKAAGLTPEQGGVSKINFGELLQNHIQENSKVQFSAHAVKRLEERALQVTPHELDRLNEGVNKLDAKGAKNSLVMVDDTAFVVSVRNKMVITAIDKATAAENVFTNIDSVAIQ